MIGLISILCFFWVEYHFVKREFGRNIREAFLSACVIFAVTLVAITEFLSVFHLLDIKHLNFAWFVVCLTAIFYSVRKKATLRTLNLGSEVKKIFLAYPTFFLNKIEDESDQYSIFILLSLILFVLVVTLFTALYFPPNTYDSMTYHMARVPHWMTNQTVAHYPTSIPRQLDSPPFAGFAILHLQILSNSDYFANMVQWVSCLGSILGVSLITMRLGGNGYTQAIAAFLCVTIPMGILQASSTQNDYVVSFWLVCFVYFMLAWLANPGINLDFLMLSQSLGLALLTKGTAYIFAFPIICLSFISVLLLCPRRKWFFVWRPIILGTSIVIVINSSHWSRNFFLFGSPLGITGNTTQTHDLNFFLYISNLVKNSTLHLTFPFDFINERLLDLLVVFHKILGVHIDDPRTTFGNLNFSFPVAGFEVSHEDVSGNLLQFLAINIVLLAVLLHSKRFFKKIYFYAFCIFSLIILYSFFIAWQPWGSRLHLPIFVLSTPLISVVLAEFSPPSKKKNQRLFLIGLAVLSLVSIQYLFLSSTRPLNQAFLSSREENYFNSNKGQYASYAEAITFLDKIDCSEVGLIFGQNTYEYPLWAISGPYGRINRKFVHLISSHNNKMLLENRSDFDICAILGSSESNSEVITQKTFALNGKKYSRTFDMDPLIIFLQEK